MKFVLDFYQTIGYYNTCAKERHKKTAKCDSGVVGNARPCQGRDRGFEPRLSLSNPLMIQGIFYVHLWYSTSKTILSIYNDNLFYTILISGICIENNIFRFSDVLFLRKSEISASEMAKSVFSMLNHSAECVRGFIPGTYTCFFPQNMNYHLLI